MRLALSTGFLLQLLVSLFAIAGTTTTPLAHAANGQCRWEGGPGYVAGVNTYTYCQQEDCIGNGGFAQCTEPEFRPSSGKDDSETDGEKFHYLSCSNAAWSGYPVFCEAAGGNFNGFDENPACSGLPAGFNNNDPQSTNSEPLAVSTADAYADEDSNCPVTLESDTGWDTPFSSTGCWGGGPTVQNGHVTRAVRRRTYSRSAPCTGSRPVYFLKLRQLKCPNHYSRRTLPNGDLHCFIPAADICRTTLNNPVCGPLGIKVHREQDYQPALNTGLRLERHYNSQPYFRLPGSGIDASGPTDHWRTNFDRRIIAATGTPGVMAIQMREDGTPRHFDSAGVEVLNRSGGADRLQNLGGSGWRLTLADHTVELYDVNGRLTSITPRDGRALTLIYDAGGRLESVTDVFGSQLVFGYNAQEQLDNVMLPGGTMVQYGYDDLGRLVTATYPDATIKTYHYEDTNNSWLLTGITDEAASRLATYDYDSDGRVTQTELAGQVNRFQYSYTNMGSSTSETRVTVTDPRGTSRTHRFSNVQGVHKQQSMTQQSNTTRCTYPGCESDTAKLYDPKGNVRQSSDFRGNRTCYLYDQTRNLELVRAEGLSSSTDCENLNFATFNPTHSQRKTTTSWHPTWRLPDIVLEAGRRETNYDYDSYGNLTQKTVTDLTAVPVVVRTWTYTYLDNGLTGRVEREDGPRTDVNDWTTYTYHDCASPMGNECGQIETITDAAGNVTTYNAYNAHGQPTQMTDPNGVVTEMAYDGRQRMTARCVNGSLPSCTGGELTSMTYYPTGLLQRVTLPDGSFTQNTYDAAHRLVRIDDALGNNIRYQLDASGNWTVEAIYDASGSISRARGRIYNALNQLASDVSTLNTASTPLDPASAPLNRRTNYLYDRDLNLTTIDAPLAGSTRRSTVQAFDALNRLDTITDALAGITNFDYDSLDQLIRVDDPEALPTTYTINAHGDQTALVSRDTGTTSQTFDSAGNVQTRTDARGAAGLATYTYDALNRPTQIVYADHTVAFVYDVAAGCTNGRGRLCSMTDQSGTTSYQYDPYGRVTQKSQTVNLIGGGSRTRSVQYGYTNGRMTSLTHLIGVRINYGHDAAGRIDSLSITYNGDQSFTTPILSNVLYEPFGPIRGWTWANGTFAVREYDADGRIETVDSAGGADYAFDEGDRITGITALSGSTVPSWGYGYDALDRLTSATGPGSQVQGFSYDANGNRMSQTGSPSGTYIYDELNNVLQSNRLQDVTGATQRDYQYDAAGNPLSDGIYSYAYNGAGRMVEVSGTTLRYNALGQRVIWGPHSGYQFTYLYDEGGRVLEKCRVAWGTPCWDREHQLYVWLDDIPVATLLFTGYYDSEGYLSYGYTERLNVHTDHLNTPRRLTRAVDATNAIVWRWDSDPFGVGFQDGNANDEPGRGDYAFDLRFPGQQFFEVTGRHYNYFRDYDPWVGRYSQSDTIGLFDGPNTYAYAQGDPVLSADPTGEFVAPLVWGIRVGVATYRAYRAARAAAAVGTAAAAAAVAANGTDNAGERQAEHDAYKAVCNQSPPLGLDPCSLAKWKRNRNQQCMNMRQAWDDKWQPGRHKTDIDNLRRAIEKLDEWIRNNCC